MTEYVVLIPGHESTWEASSEEQKAEVYAKHGEFARLLAERGHKVIGGNHLSPSREAKIVRNGAGGLAVTDGPYAETVEQLTGYYLIDTDDLDDLLEVVGVLASAEGAIEVRPTVDHSGDMA
ncbi:MAG: transcription initiation protein [Nocardioides sp.]|nr:transcription initiation protein [Nocardioides sp.]